MRSRFSDVVALLALFVALGGVSYAALKLPAKSVGAKQLKKNAVNSKKVKNGSLKAKDFKAGQLPAGAKGETGATGATGAQGPAGADGQDFEFGRVVVVKGDGTDAENGQALMAAAASVVSASGRHMIWIEPGHYLITAPLTLNNRTVLAGAGRTVTTIEATGLANVVTGGREVRDLAVELESPVGNTVALQGENAFDTDYRQLEVYIRAENAGVASVIGIRTRGFRVIDDVEVSVNTLGSSATASTGIVVTNGASQVIRDSDVLLFSASGGIALDLQQSARVDETRLRAHTSGDATAVRTSGSSSIRVVIHDSKLRATGTNLTKASADEAAGRIFIVDSEVEGSPLNDPACVDSYTLDYGATVNPDCT